MNTSWSWRDGSIVVKSLLPEGQGLLPGTHVRWLTIVSNSGSRGSNVLSILVSIGTCMQMYTHTFTCARTRTRMHTQNLKNSLNSRAQAIIACGSMTTAACVSLLHSLSSPHTSMALCTLLCIPFSSIRFALRQLHPCVLRPLFTLPHCPLVPPTPAFSFLQIPVHLHGFVSFCDPLSQTRSICLTVGLDLPSGALSVLLCDLYLPTDGFCLFVCLFFVGVGWVGRLFLSTRVDPPFHSTLYYEYLTCIAYWMYSINIYWKREGLNITNWKTFRVSGRSWRY